MMGGMAGISTIPVVQELAALMLAHGVARCVLCPGSRNSPIVATLSALPEFECRGATDERSAGFMALGWAAQCGGRVAVCVTSGSALLNLHPAVAEAYYRNIPLLVISADRPAAWIGQQDGQTLPQPGAFGPLAHHFELPETADAWHRNRVLNEALLPPADAKPVHLNIPLAEPLFGIADAPLPAPRVIRRGMPDAAELADCTRRLILLGQLAQGVPAEEVRELESMGYAVVAEHLANTPAATCTQPDLVVGPEPGAEWSPDLLITVGGCIISKRLKNLLRTNPPKRHWHVSPTAEVVDTFRHLTRCVPGDAAGLPALLRGMGRGDSSYVGKWKQAPATFPTGGYNGMVLTGRVLQNLPRPCTLHLANSSVVRYAQLHPLPQGVQVECNRGVNGIEGSLSTAIGYAMGDTRPNIILCGDLSFFYDMNALWLQGIRGNVRILLLNNGGGGIFTTLPMAANDFVQGKHPATAQAWAEACGFRYLALTPDTPEAGIAGALAALTPPSPEQDRPVFVEAFTDSEADAAALRLFLSTH